MKKLLCIALLAALSINSDITADWPSFSAINDGYLMRFNAPSWVPDFTLSTIIVTKDSWHGDEIQIYINKFFLAAVAAYGGYKLYKAYYPDTPVQKEDEIAILEEQNVVEADLEQQPVQDNQEEFVDSKTIEQNSQENLELAMIQRLQSEDIKNQWQTAAYKAVTASAIVFAAATILDSYTFASITDSVRGVLYDFLRSHGL